MELETIVMNFSWFSILQLFCIFPDLWVYIATGLRTFFWHKSDSSKWNSSISGQWSNFVCALYVDGEKLRFSNPIDETGGLLLGQMGRAYIGKQRGKVFLTTVFYVILCRNLTIWAFLKSHELQNDVALLSSSIKSYRLKVCVSLVAVICSF